MVTLIKKPIPPAILSGDDDSDPQLFLGDFVFKEELRAVGGQFCIIHKPICQYCGNEDWDGRCMYCRR